VPLHFTAFHPDYRMTDISPTPPETLRRARAIARREGLRHVYTGNVHDREGGTTSCAACGAAVIERDWYQILSSNLVGSACGGCGAAIAGRFGEAIGDFGRRRMRVVI
jgi:pyruvate formate lyase activating enzyme